MFSSSPVEYQSAEPLTAFDAAAAIELQLEQIENLAALDESFVPLVTNEDTPETRDENVFAADLVAGTEPIDDGESLNKTNLIESAIQEVIFVSDDVTNYQDLISDITHDGGSLRDFIVVAAGSEGLTQISEALKNYHDLQAIHIVSHGGEQGLRLGGAWLGAENATAYSSQIAAWGQALSAEGDLLLYGCEVAEGTAGREFLQWLGESTQADIAASTDLTGSSTLGGNWSLEYHVGQIETAAILGDHSNLQWHGVLATVTVSTGSDVSDGNTSSIANLIASKGADGQISLREAITAANNTPGADAINWSQGSGAKSSLLASALPFITDTVTIDATTQPGYAGAPLITLNGASAGGATSGFVVRANDVVIKGFVIQSFGADGIRIETGTNALIENNRIGTSANGASDFGNGGDGIQINTANNTVRNNLISGNNAYGIFLSGSGASGNTIVGNLIGTSANGSADLGNSLSGIRITGGSGNTIGGAGASLGNTISGNNNSGIELFAGATGNLILGNYLGTNSAGNADLGNSLDGIYLDGSSGNTIGAPGAGNVISGNDIHGIRLLNSSSGNTILSNIVGLDVTGTIDLGNTYNGIYVADGSSSNIIGGIGAGNVVSGNNDTGIEVQDSSSTGNLIRGNYVGTNAAGTAAIGNLDGIIIEDAPSNTIGGVLAGQGNLISGNSGGAGTGNGVIIFGSNAIGNLVQGNTIGANATRTAAIANTGHGVWISDRGDSGTIKGSAQNNTVGGAVAGAGNYIAYNGLDGIAVTSSGATGNSLRRNTILSNGGLAIDLGDNGVTNNDGGDGDLGPNLQQNFPTIASAKSNGSELRITGSLNSTAASTFNIDFYWSTVADGSAHGEAQNYAGSTTVVTDGAGNSSFNVTFSGSVPVGAFVTATATSASGNTSEFALNATSIAALGISYPGSPLAWTADDGPTVIDPSAALSNPQSLDWTGGNLTVNFSSGGTLTDELLIYGPGTVGALSVASGTNVRYHSGGSPTTFATLAGGTAGAPLIVTFNASATDAIVQTLLRSIEYNNSASPPISSRSVQFVLTSGSGETSNPESETINVGPANNAPGITVGNVALSYTENGPAVVIDSAINLSDTDSPNLAQAVIRISANFAAGQDVLTYDSTLATSFGINGNYNATTGELTLSGSSSVANYEQVLETVAYLNSSENPSTAVRTIEFTVSDGFDTGSDSRNVNIVPTNDAPNLDLDADNSLTPGLNAIANFIAGQGAVLIVDNDALTSDVDNATWQSITVTITNRLDGAAEVLAANTGGTSLTANYNAGSGMLTISGVGTIAEYQQVLRTVTYNNSAANPNTTQRLIDFVANDGTDDSPTARSTVYIQAAGGLYLTTEDDVAASGAPGLANWQMSDVLKFGAPGLTLGTNTAGTFSLEAAMSAFGGSKNVNAIDFISRDIQIGGQSFAPMQLEYGDLLLSVKSSDSFTGSDAQTIFVTKDDVFVFRPDTAGDYSSGRFIFLLNDLSQGTDVVSLVLVEQDTLVGDVVVEAGTFLYSQGSTDKQTIFAFKASDVGQFTTAGTRQIFIDGGQIGINEGIVGLDLVENTMSIGGQSLAAGNLIVSVDNAEPVGDGAGLAVTAHDMFVLNITATTLGSGNASATATMFFDGGDVGLSTLLTEELSGLALITSEGAPTVVAPPGNNAPTVNDQTFGAAENTVNGSIIGTVSASDSDSGANGTLTYSVTGGNGATAFAVDTLTGVITVADVSQLNYEATTSFTLDVQVTDGGTPGLSDTATITITLANINEAPTDLLPASANVNEGTDTSGGVSVAVLTTTDPDAGESFTYSILPGGDAANFSIGGFGNDELVLTAGLLNFETKNAYSVTVRSTDSAGNVIDRLVTVSVVDLNELPVINNQTFGIDENSANGTPVGIVVAADPDTGANGTLTYAITGGSGATAFAINPTTGEITVADASQLDFEATTSFSLQIQVSDGGAPNLSSTATITINLNNVNEAPTDLTPVSFSLNEENDTTSGLALGALVTVDPDAGETFTYTIRPGADAANFSIGGFGNDELVLTAGLLNFETKNAYSVTVRSTDSAGNVIDRLVTVSVVDLNELPVINNQTFSIDENSANGTPVGIVVATDPDTGANGTLTHTITGGSGATAFAINPTTGEITVADASQLDFETTTSFTLTVQASDDGAPNLSSTATITINLNNVNEAPTDLTPFSFSLNEGTDTTSGLALGTLATVDPDAGETFTYTIRPGGDAANFSIGGIGDDELVLTAGVLNFESKNVYTVTVRSTDSAGNIIDRLVTVNVNDLNELPVINNQSFGVNENSANGTPVGTVVASDQDSGANGSLTYAITGGSGATAFAINRTTGEITVADASQLDFEATTSFTLTVQASDSGAPALSATATVTINVLDVNESPTDIAPNSMTLPENTDTTGGLSVGVLTATDVDAAETFTYTILPGADAAKFSIGGVGSNELILTDGILDFETKSSYNVTVRVTDSAGNFYDETLTVNGSDLNESPIIGNQSFAIIENQPNGTVVGSVVASDPDSGANGTLTYSIVGGTGATAFTMDSVSGQITVADQSQLDFETNPSFTLQIQVTDGGTPGLNAVATITINLLDGNELPTDISPNRFTVVENTDTTSGLSLGILTAIDPDPLETFTYAILPGGDGTLFSIGGGASNELVISDGVLDYERKNNYVVTVRVTDSAGNTYDETLTLAVVDQDENPIADVGGPYLINEGSGVALDGSASSDPEGSALSYRWDLNNDGVFGDVVGAIPSVSWSTLNSWGITNQGVHSIGLQVADMSGNLDEMFTTLTVNNVPPTASNDLGTGYEANEDIPFVTANVLLNDSDPNSNDILAVTGLDLTGTRGIVVDNGDGTFSYDPNGQFENFNFGDTAFDSFVYTVDDGSGTPAFGTVAVTIHGVNDEQQIVQNNVLGAFEGGIVVLDNSFLQTIDVDNSTSDLIYRVTGGLANGHLELIGAPGVSVTTFTQANVGLSQLVYIHSGSETSSDHFDFTVDDGTGAKSLATMFINIAPVNDAPVATNDHYLVLGNPLVLLNPGLLANDYDVDSTTLSITVLAGAANGSLTWSANGAIVYSPAPGFFGVDTITYVTTDGSATSLAATVTIDVLPVGVLPVDPPSTAGEDNEDTDEPDNAVQQPPTLQLKSVSKSKVAVSGIDVSMSNAITVVNSVKGFNDVNSEVIEESIDSQQTWSRFLIRSSRIKEDEMRTSGSTSNLNFMTQAGSFWHALDEFRQLAENSIGLPALIVGGTTLAASSISAGYIVWLVRGGQVLAALMSNLPAWRLIDPLPIMGAFTAKDDENEDSLESLLSEETEHVNATSWDDVVPQTVEGLQANNQQVTN